MIIWLIKEWNLYICDFMYFFVEIGELKFIFIFLSFYGFVFFMFFEYKGYFGSGCFI